MDREKTGKTTDRICRKISRKHRFSWAYSWFPVYNDWELTITIKTPSSRREAKRIWGSLGEFNKLLKRAALASGYKGNIHWEIWG